MELQETQTKRIPVGRPLKFQSVEELEKSVTAWYKQRTKLGKPLTVTSLALALDTSRETLLEYQERPEFVDTIKRAKLMCETYAEEQLYRESGQVAGVIFSMKNNYNWRDKSEVDQNMSGSLGVQVESVNYSDASNAGTG